MKNFSVGWREELKGTILYDLFAARQASTVMRDNISKVFKFSLRNLEGRAVDVTSELEVIYSKQPHVINFLDSYYAWIN